MATNKPYQWSRAAKFTASRPSSAVACTAGWRNRPVARLYSRRHSAPSSVTAAIVQARPASTGPIISGSSTSQEPSRSHSSRRSADPAMPVSDRQAITAAPASTTAPVADTSSPVTGLAKASFQEARANISAAARGPAATAAAPPSAWPARE